MSAATDTGGPPGGERETAACTKCTSEIPVEADRCPECGYEASPGVLGGIIMWIAGGIGALFALIAVVSVLLVVSGGLDITSGFTTGVVCGGITAVCFGLVRLGLQQSERGPTEGPMFD